MLLMVDRLAASYAGAEAGSAVRHALDSQHPHRSVLVSLESGGQNWKRIQVTVDQDPTLYKNTYLEQERRALGEDRFKREYLGVPAGGLVSPFDWGLFDRAAQTPVNDGAWQIFKPSVIVHDVGCTRDRSTAVVGGRTILAPGLSLAKEFNELPQGLIGSARAEALASIDSLYGGKSLIFADLTFDPTYAEILLERFGQRVIGLRITSSGDGMKVEPLPVKNGAIRVYSVARTYLFDLLLRELHGDKVRILDGAASRRAYEQLILLEMEYRQTGTIYKCPSGRHDDLAISTGWALQHPHLPYWMRALEPRPARARRAAPNALGWT